MKGLPQCITTCSESKTSCISKTDYYYDYVWQEAKENECCGICSKTPSMHENTLKDFIFNLILIII